MAAWTAAILAGSEFTHCRPELFATWIKASMGNWNDWTFGKPAVGVTAEVATAAVGVATGAGAGAAAGTAVATGAATTGAGVGAAANATGAVDTCAAVDASACDTATGAAEAVARSK